jgi:pilus assembly protein Flp/PilA
LGRKRLMLNRVKSFLRSEDGPTATEYAVMLGLIIVTCIGTITLLGDKVASVFNDTTDQLP